MRNHLLSWRTWERGRTTVYGLVLALFAVALLVTIGRGSLVSAAQIDLTSVYVDAELPIGDPSSSLWDSAPEVEVPLSGQNITAPFNINTSIDTIRTKSLHNGGWIAFRMEWDDDSKDIGGGSADYRDSVALQFPVHGGEPFVCMGFVGSEVNILHWRADFQRRIEDGPLSISDIFPNAFANIYNQASDPLFTTARAAGNPLSASVYPSPVEDLIATGYGTLESQESVDVTGWGEWDGSKWSVVIARPLITADPQDAQFEPGIETPVALAVWNGEERDVNGKKSVSAWINVGVEELPVAAGGATPPEGRAAPVGGGAVGAAPAIRVDDDGEIIWAVIGALIALGAVAVIVPGVYVAMGRRRNSSSVGGG